MNHNLIKENQYSTLELSLIYFLRFSIIVYLPYTGLLAVQSNLQSPEVRPLNNFNP